MPALESTAEPIRIAVVADIPAAASEIARALRHLGHTVCSALLDSPTASARVQSISPEVVLLRTGPRSFDSASAFACSATDNGAALVVLTPVGSPRSTELARGIGAAVHLVEPLPSHALLAAVHVAIARNSDLRHLRSELISAREAAHSRTAIERAKAILVKRLGLTEDEAHRRLQSESRSRNRKLSETAWHVIQADAALKSRERASLASTAPRT